MTLDWYDGTSNTAALAAYAGDLESETSNLFRLLDRYFTGDHDETYLGKFAEAAPGYIGRSLKALNIPDWDTLRYQLKKAAALLRTNRPDEADHIENLLGNEQENASARASILVTVVWPMLQNTIAGDSRIAEKCGCTVEEWLKLDLTSKSREYSRMKKREQTQLKASRV
jgi:hypothetical protein